MIQQPPHTDPVSAAVAAAARFHQAGELTDARRLYEAVLEADPDHTVALNWLGLVAHQMGDHEYAAAQLSKALNLDPDFAEAHCSLGAVLKGLKRPHEAIESYQNALSLKPGYFDARFNLGIVYQSQEMFSEAAIHYRQALLINATHIGTLMNMGTVYLKLERYDEAAAALKKAISLDPDNPGLHINLGNVYQEVGKLDLAAQCFKTALRLNPDQAETFGNLGIVLKQQGRLDEALEMATRAVQIDPNSALAHNSLGLVYLDKGELEEANVAFDKSMALQPDFADALNNKGVALKLQGNLQEAIKCHRKAIEINPENPPARYNLGLDLLMDRNFAEGMELYNWRWKTSPHKFKWRQFPQPQWDGADLSGKRLLVWGEQGVGDEIVFASLYRELLARAGTCVFECEPRLVPLYERSFPSALIVAKTEPVNPQLLSMDIDFQCPAADLPKWLLPAFDDTVGRENYLIADKSQVANLRARYQTPDKSKIVGLGWMTQHPSMKWHYNFATDVFDRLLKTPNVQFVCLQYGDNSRELAQIRERTGVTIIQDDGVNPLESLDSFAAQEASMDLVISIVNSTAVMASGLGVPVWGVLPKVSEWRWGNQGQSNLWYPSMRVFRPPSGGSWDDVSEQLTDAFRHWAAS